MKMRNEYFWLWIVSIFLKAIAIINLVGTLIYLIIVGTSSLQTTAVDVFNGSSMMLFYVGFSILSFLGSAILFGLAELIKVFVKIEFNTRLKNEAHNIEQPILTTPANSSENLEYIEWKKENPDKSINEFFIYKNNKL